MSNINIQIEEPNGERISGTANMMLIGATAIVVNDQASYEAANEQAKLIKKKYKALETQRKGITAPINEAKAKIMDLFRPPLELLSNAEKIIKIKMLDYMKVQNDIKREEEAKARDEQRKEQDKMREEGMHAAKQGDTEMAGYYFSQAEHVPVSARQVEKPKAKGASAKKVWKARVINIVDLAQAVVDGKVNSDLLLPNQPMLNDLAKALKGDLNIPGVAAEEETSLAIRTK